MGAGVEVISEVRESMGTNKKRIESARKEAAEKKTRG
jgi:predicted house-cleaning noncanonical NTP pyrophosphatase (MazG superfamily)